MVLLFSSIVALWTFNSYYSYVYLSAAQKFKTKQKLVELLATSYLPNILSYE